MNKTEIIKWFIDHIFENSYNPDFAIDDLWLILSALIEFLNREQDQETRERTMNNIRSMLKGLLYLER